MEVTLDPLGGHRFRKHSCSSLNSPTYEDLGWGFVESFGDLNDKGVVNGSRLIASVFACPAEYCDCDRKFLPRDIVYVVPEGRVSSY